VNSCNLLLDLRQCPGTPGDRRERENTIGNRRLNVIRFTLGEVFRHGRPSKDRDVGYVLESKGFSPTVEFIHEIATAVDAGSVPNTYRRLPRKSCAAVEDRGRAV
jgi:hypothetical protein